MYWDMAFGENTFFFCLPVQPDIDFDKVYQAVEIKCGDMYRNHFQRMDQAQAMGILTEEDCGLARF